MNDVDNVNIENINDQNNNKYFQMKLRQIMNQLIKKMMN